MKLNKTKLSSNYVKKRLYDNVKSDFIYHNLFSIFKTFFNMKHDIIIFNDDH